MRRTDALILLLAGLLVAGLAASQVTAPGYMDADYYYATALRLAQGHGMSEPFVWNYLDSPRALPHPAFLYWMPLPALLAAVPMALTGGLDFNMARLPFVLIAAGLPLLTYWLAWSLTGKRAVAWLAGGFALLPGYYLPYLLTTESFGLCMGLGTLLVLTIYPTATSRWQHWPGVTRFVAVGGLAGLMHLSRADGLVWLAAALAASVLEIYLRMRRGQPWRVSSLEALDALAGTLLGYALVTGFWYGRNLALFGSLMPPGGSKTLWLSEYNQTFTYYPDGLNFTSLAATGVAGLVKTRLAALLDNLKTWGGVQGSIVLWPLALAGLWRLRADRRVRFATVMWLAVLGVFSFVFPFAGARGGFFHSGAAFQPLTWVAAAVGFEQLMEWGVRRRGWGETRSRRMFVPALLAVLLIFTGIQYSNRVIGPDPAHPKWRAGWDAYQAVEFELARLGAVPCDSVMVNNPPGFYAATGRSAVVLPAEDQTGVMLAARQFVVSYLILDENTPPQMMARYRNPASDADLAYLGAAGQAQIYRVIDPTNRITP